MRHTFQTLVRSLYESIPWLGLGLIVALGPAVATHFLRPQTSLADGATAAFAYVVAFYFVMRLSSAGLECIPDAPADVVRPSRRGLIVFGIFVYVGLNAFAGPVAATFLLALGLRWAAIPFLLGGAVCAAAVVLALLVLVVILNVFRPRPARVLFYAKDRLRALGHVADDLGHWRAA